MSMLALRWSNFAHRGCRLHSVRSPANRRPRYEHSLLVRTTDVIRNAEALLVGSVPTANSPCCSGRRHRDRLLPRRQGRLCCQSTESASSGMPSTLQQSKVWRGPCLRISAALIGSEKPQIRNGSARRGFPYVAAVEWRAVCYPYIFVVGDAQSVGSEVNARPKPATAIVLVRRSPSLPTLWASPTTENIRYKQPATRRQRRMETLRRSVANLRFLTAMRAALIRKQRAAPHF